MTRFQPPPERRFLVHVAEMERRIRQLEHRADNNPAGISGPVSSLVTGSVTNSVSETVIGTFTLPANDMVANAGYRFEVAGTADTTGTPTINIRARFTSASGTLLWATGSLTARTATGMYWTLAGWMYCLATGASGSVFFDATCHQAIVAAGIAENLNGVTGGTVDTTSTVLVVVTAQWGTASTSNTCRTLAGSISRTGLY